MVVSHPEEPIVMENDNVTPKHQEGNDDALDLFQSGNQFTRGAIDLLE